MLTPFLRARIEQQNQFSCYRVHPCQIRPLVTITAVASEGEIICGIVRNMLLCQDVFDMKTPNDVGLRQLAVFTPFAGGVGEQVVRQRKLLPPSGSGLGKVSGSFSCKKMKYGEKINQTAQFP